MSVLTRGAYGQDGRIVNRQRSVKSDPSLIFYRYKGVDLPLKRFEEIRGNRPLIRIVDGRNTLWVAERKSLNQVLEQILEAELDAMTASGDDLYFGGRFSGALDAYQQIYDVMIKHDGVAEDLENYPAVRAYLLLRMGQCNSRLIRSAHEEAIRLFDQADGERARADAVKDSRTQGHMTDFYLGNAQRLTTEALAAVARADVHRKTARDLLRRALDAHKRAAHGNRELYQAHNELGILAFWEGSDLLVDGKLNSAEDRFNDALAAFQSARAASRGQEYILDNLVATYSALADIDHSRGDFSAALAKIERAMAVLPAPEEIDDEDSDGAGASDSFLVTFKSYQPSRGEEIVVRAPLEAGLVAKYLTIERDRENWGAASAAAQGLGKDPTWALWLREGARFQKAQDWEGAAAFYEGLYTAYIYGRDDVEAPQSFQDTVQQALVQSFRKLGERLYADRRYDEAVALYERALRYVPNSEVLSSGSVMAAIGQADDALAAGQWEDGLARLRPLKKIYSADLGTSDTQDKEKILALIDTRVAAAHLGLSNRELLAGKLSEAASHADAALELGPDRRDYREAKARVLTAYARAAEASGPDSWEAAKKYYDQAIDVAPFLPQLRLASGSLALRMQAATVQKDAAGFLRAYGVLLLVLGLGLVVAFPVGRAAVNETSRRRRVRALRSRGLRAYNEMQWHDAVAALNDYRRLVRGAINPDILEVLARSYRRIGDYDSALRNFDMAAARSKRSYHLERCEIYLVRRNLPLAVQALRASDDLASDVLRMLEFIGQLRESQGKAPFFREATGALYLVSGDPDEARLQFKRLHDDDPDNPRYIRQLLNIARLTEDERGRRQWLEALVAIDRRDANVRRELGEMLIEAGELARGIELLERAQEIHWLEPTAKLLDLARTRLEIGEAQTELAVLIEKPRHPAGDLRMAELYMQLDRPDVARRLLYEHQNHPQVGLDAARLLGLLAFRDRQYAEAVRLLRTYLTRRPNLEPDAKELQARWCLGLSHEGLGQHELAAVQYRAIYEVDRAYEKVAEKLRSPKFSRAALPGATVEPDVNPESSAIRELDEIDLPDPEVPLDLDLGDDEDTHRSDD